MTAERDQLGVQFADGSQAEPESKTSLVSGFGAKGYACIRSVLQPPDIDALLTLFNERQAGKRLFEIPLVLSRVLTRASFHSLITSLIGEHARPVRLILFDKSAKANWSLGWHQDRMIAVKQQHPIDGFKNWTKKGGVHHVEPPFELIQNMVSARFFLSDCGPQDGCLEIIPGSHKQGHLSNRRVDEVTNKALPLNMIGAAGDLLLLSTSIVHRSGPTTRNRPRPTIHIDYSAATLPAPLEWALDWSLSES